MPRVIGVVPSRGGVGSSTIAAHLAHAFALDGKRVALCGGGLQGVDLELARTASPLSASEEPVLAIVTEETVEAAIEQASFGFDVVVADLPPGFISDAGFDAVVVVANLRAASMVATWQAVEAWQGVAPVSIVVNGVWWPGEGQWAARHLRSCCAEFGSLKVTGTASVGRSYLFSRWSATGKSSFLLAAWFPGNKSLVSLAQTLLEQQEAEPKVDLREVRSERAA